MKTVSWLRLFFILLAFTASRAIGATDVRVQPEPSDELLANPGMGWQTFQQFADTDRNLAGLPSASAYFRFYWRELEPADDQIDFAKLDDLFAHAHKAGQKLAFRIMCTGSGQYMDVPAWLKDKGCHGIEFKYGGRNHWVPDFSDPLFREAHFRLIRELGKRYDGHPDMDLLDIGSVGLWGEWHMSSTEALDTGKPVPLPTPQERLAIIDAWCAAFPNTPKVILIGSEEGMLQAVSKRYGWRADCLGDMGGFSKNWNHMQNMYPQQIQKTGAAEAWKNAPVAYESCWDMRKWKESGWDIRNIYDFALATHASYMNNKSAPIPEGTRAEVERFLKRMGYRLALRSFEHPATLRAGSPFTLKMIWQNEGVAPPYRDYFVSLRLKTLDGAAQSAPVILKSTESVRGWLPGSRETSTAFTLPGNCKPGQYELALGLLGVGGTDPVVRLAVKGRDSQGWYPLSKVTVNAP